MKKILTAIAIMATIASAKELTVLACPISPVASTRCVSHKVTSMPRFEINLVKVDLPDGTFVLYNLAGWSISITDK